MAVPARVVFALIVAAAGCHTEEPLRVKPELMRLPADVAKLREPLRVSLAASAAEFGAISEASRVRREAEIQALSTLERSRSDRIREQGGLGAAIRANIVSLRDSGPQSLHGSRSSEYFGNWEKTIEDLARSMVPCVQPSIAMTNVEPIVPVQPFTIEGCAFGEATGVVELTFSVVFSRGSPGEEYLDPCDTTVDPKPKIQLIVDVWTDDQIQVHTSPASPLLGYIDQLVSLEVTRVDGAKSDPFPVQFFATRVTKTLPGHYFDFSIENPRTDDEVHEFMDCVALGLPMAGTWQQNVSFSVDHFHGCCYPQVTGHDAITAKVFNGWKFLRPPRESWHGYKTMELGNEAGNLVTYHPPPWVWHNITSQGPAQMLELDCDWWVDHVESGVVYSMLVQIEGPAGVRFGDPARFEAWECSVGQNCSSH